MDSEYYKEYYILERNHWWFKARMDILRSLIKFHIATISDQKISILNSGIATGATSQMLNEFGLVTSLEYDSNCCQFIREHVGLDVIEGSLTALPFENESFDLVCAFDVLEHIENHDQAVKEMQRVLKPGGHLYVTVPAYQFLWSEHDVINHHFRRYTRTNLTQLFQNNTRLIKVRTSYFNTFLFLPAFIARMISNIFGAFIKSKKVKSDFERFKPNSLSNRFFENIFSSELHCFKLKFNFPFGVSLYSIYKKG
jgi:SAM-dependent methyltransferase